MATTTLQQGKQVVKAERGGWVIVPIPQKGMFSLLTVSIDTNYYF